MTAGRTVNSQSHHWNTPTKYVDIVTKFYGGEIDLDPCSNDGSIVNARVEYKLPYQDGLNEEWNYRKIYVNPPYGKDYERNTTIKDWLKKCAKANENGSEVLALVPVATNTSHWKQYVFTKASAVCFLNDTRLKFRVNGNEDNKGSPVSNAIIYWGEDFDKFYKLFNTYGNVADIRHLK